MKPKIANNAEHVLIMDTSEVFIPYHKFNKIPNIIGKDDTKITRINPL